MAKEQETTAGICATKGVSVEAAVAAFFPDLAIKRKKNGTEGFYISFHYVFTLLPSGSGKSSVKHCGGSRQVVDRWLSLQTFLVGSFPGG